MNTVSLEDVVKEPFVEREQGSGTRSAVEAALREHGVSGFNSVVQVSSTEAVKQCVKAGIGVSFLSERAVRDSGLETVEVEGMTVRRHFHMVIHRLGERKRTVQALLELAGKKVDGELSPPEE
jgi:DNA-binding transcriptional LysR family regulator